jgi:hypothetical protein
MMLSVGFSVGFLLRKIFSHRDLPLNPTPNLTLVYRRELSTLWRRLEKLEAIELEASDKIDLQLRKDLG